MRLKNLALTGLILASFTCFNIGYAATETSPEEVEVLIHEHKLDAALDECNKGLAAHPNSVALLHKRIVIYKLLNEQERAHPDFDKLIELTKDKAEKQSIMAYSAMYFGKLEEAKTHIDEAIKLAPKNAEYYATRAEILVAENKKNAPQALADIDKAVSLDPNFFGVYFARARIYLELGDRQKAAADFAKAEKLKAEHMSQKPSSSKR